MAEGRAARSGKPRFIFPTRHAPLAEGRAARSGKPVALTMEFYATLEHYEKVADAIMEDQKKLGRARLGAPVFEQLHTHTRQLKTLESDVGELKIGQQNIIKALDELKASNEKNARALEDKIDRSNASLEDKIDRSNVALEDKIDRSNVALEDKAECSKAAPRTEIAGVTASQQAASNELRAKMIRCHKLNCAIAIMIFTGIIISLIGSAVAIYLTIS